MNPSTSASNHNRAIMGASDASMSTIGTTEPESSDFDYGSDRSANLNVPTDVDYWYGKQHFEAIVAQLVFLHVTSPESMSTPDVPVANADSRLQSTIRAFPFDEALQLIRAEPLRLFQLSRYYHGSDSYKMFLSLIGLTIRTGDYREIEFLERTINRSTGLASVKPVDSPAQRSTTPVPRPLRYSKEQPSPPVIDRDVNNGRYTSMLKEYADFRGISVDYRVESVLNEQEPFRAELLYQGRSFFGSGKSKAAAKHQASRNACDWLETQRHSKE